MKKVIANPFLEKKTTIKTGDFANATAEINKSVPTNSEIYIIY